MGFFNYLGSVLIVSAFYSLLLTTSIHTIPELQDDVVISFTDSPANLDFDDSTLQFQDSISKQKRFGVVDLGALALFSGNIVVDLAANFLFAIPSMFTLFFGSLFNLIPINSFLQKEILIWVQGLLSIISALLLIQFLLGARTASLGAV